MEFIRPARGDMNNHPKKKLQDTNREGNKKRPPAPAPGPARAPTQIPARQVQNQQSQPGKPTGKRPESTAGEASFGEKHPKGAPHQEGKKREVREKSAVSSASQRGRMDLPRLKMSEQGLQR